MVVADGCLNSFQIAVAGEMSLRTTGLMMFITTSTPIVNVLVEIIVSREGSKILRMVWTK